MDLDSSSSEEIKTINIAEEQTLTLPEISAPTTKKTDSLTPSLLVLAEKRMRTIDTEFGTIVVDSDGIKIQSRDHGDRTVTPTDKSRDPSARKFDAPKHELVQSDSIHTGGSRMILFNPSKTAARVLSSVTERKAREERGVWRSDSELLAVACSSLVSATTLLYMPHLSLHTSGGAFLLMYASCHVLFGAPLLLLEAVLGQYSAHGLAKLMPAMAPVLRGYAYAVPLSLVIIAVTYMPLVSNTALYSVEATGHPAAWARCNSSYNTPRCYTQALDLDCQKRGAVFYAASHCLSQKEACEGSDNTTTGLNMSSACIVHPDKSITFNHSRLHDLRRYAGEEFFQEVSFAVIPGLKNAHVAEALSLLCCWTVVGLIAHGGAARVRYTLPLVIGAPLIIVIALTITLIQSHQGAWSLLTVDKHSLVHSTGWLNAAKYVVCSQGTGLGVNTFIYSRNMLTHNCKRSVLTLVALKLSICILVVVCYALLVSAHAATVGEELEELNGEYGEYHALVRLTSVLSTLSGSRVWSVLMLLAIVLAGLGSVQIILLTIEASLRELGLVRGLSTRIIILLLCAAFFVANLISTISSSYFIRSSIYQHASVYLSVALSFALVVAVNTTLSVEHLLEDVRVVMAVPMRWSWYYWRISWRILSPVVLLLLFFGTIVEQAMMKMESLYGKVPGWTLTLSGVLATGPVLVLIGFVTLECQRPERRRSDLDVTAPTKQWRPGLLDDKAIRERLSQEQIVEKSSHALIAPVSSLMTHVYSPVAKWSIDEAAVVEEEKDEDETIQRQYSPCFRIL